jgi:flagellar hook-associated protein 1
MSLLSSLSVARSALFINQLGQRVVGNNIANANTPGYATRDLYQVTAPFQKYGNHSLGLGVQLGSISRRTSSHLLTQYRNTLGDANGVNAQAQTLTQLELLHGELGDSDVSTLLSQFFDSLNDVANQPESDGARQVVLQQAQLLTSRIRNIAGGAQDLRATLNSDIKNSVTSTNQLIHGIAKLNSQIVEDELGQTGIQTSSLRDQRDQLVTQLSEYLDVKIVEQDNGAVNILYQGSSLISNDRFQLLELSQESVKGNLTFRVSLEQSGIPVKGGGGILGGQIESRDNIVDTFIDQWNDFARKFIHGFNRLHSTGQGLTGFQGLTGSFQIDYPTKSLAKVGFDYPPNSGSFQLLVTDTETGQIKTTDISVHLEGLTTDTSLEDIVESINNVEGITAVINSAGQLSITSDTSNVEFSFANDTSGVLAALGVNTFFSGTDASNIGVNSTILNDPGKLASSTKGPGTDTELILQLANFADQKTALFGDRSLREGYESIISDTALKSNSASTLADGLIHYAASLGEQHQSLTGVNLDEEAIKMLRYEQAYSAATRYLQTVNEMIDELLSI